MRRPFSLLVLVAAVLLTAAPALAQSGGSSLRVTVLDETAAVLPGATVLLVGDDGIERTLQVDETGVASATGLTPGTYTIGAEYPGFRPAALTLTVKRGANQTAITLAVAISEDVTVAETDAAERRDNGFTQTLSQDEIDALSDDADEMAEQLAQMAGPGAQIFVDGFRGGRLPPKDQIQQIRFRTNSYAAEYHDAGMVRVEVITKPGMGAWRSRVSFGFRDSSLNARNAFASAAPPEQVKRVQVSSQGPIVKGKTSVTFSADGNASYDSQTIGGGHADGRRARPGAASERRHERQRPRRAGARRRQRSARRVPTPHAGPQQPRRRRLRPASSAPTPATRRPTRCGCATRGSSARRSSAS